MARLENPSALVPINGQAWPGNEVDEHCDICEKVLSVFHHPFEEWVEVHLGLVSDVIKSPCSHVEWIIRTRLDCTLIGPPLTIEDYESRWIRFVKWPESTRAQLLISYDTSYKKYYGEEWRDTCQIGGNQVELVKHSSKKAYVGWARLLDKDWINLDIIRNWMDCCRREHKPQCRDRTLPATEEIQPLWLIDVIDGCVVPSPGRVTYITLSYTWGQTKNFRTLSSNLEQVQRPHSLVSGDIAKEIPETIRNAFDLVRLLGERYLWVDSICIVQDHTRAVESELYQMHRIYSSSFMTIIAKDGTAANHGLRGVPGVSQARAGAQKIIRLSGGEMLSEAADSPSPPSSAYDQRMWTFQEELFANRSLIFELGRVTWRCNCAVWHEHLLEHKRESSVEKSQLHSHMTDWINMEFPKLWDLHWLIGVFNSRVLTFPGDVLHAFSGIQTSLHSIFPGGVLFGHPELFFDTALVWRGDKGIRPRWNGRHPSMHDNLPSWSWMAWEGTIMFIADGSTHRDWFQVATGSITTWYARKSPNSTEKRRIECTWDNYLNECPPGWTRYARDPMKQKYWYVHEEKELKLEYPVPVLCKGMIAALKEQYQYVSCETTHAFITMAPEPVEEGNCFAGVVLQDDLGNFVGRLEPHYRQVSMVPEKIELVAIVRGRYEHREGSIEYVEDCYFVLWIEWENHVAYRRTSGYVLTEKWEALREKAPIELILG
ncbi:heterokaryon incompatibility protein-domain-containing protein [Truncatella angustata]|uniref:Heterokaryon incompatibility protein-domain-containing protein n=1 Tax=Truncatella angustata TaxID=152316 RepID=A0A9P8UHC9_9PEZI|nr:heterokaryon incompatibility protein-domain-containing protein [Truncatella angustata]KAH6652239.1 heterokaryon incompatibility protein-domain-containing protein [Truncatella angustata]